MLPSCLVEREKQRERERESGGGIVAITLTITMAIYQIYVSSFLATSIKKGTGKKYRQQVYVSCGRCQGVASVSMTF